MMADIGYEADAEYIAGTIDVFGKFDTDGGGTIGMNEFPVRNAQQLSFSSA
jgi:hypothetical protein